MYFKSRADAGRLLAEKLIHYDNQLCAVVALSPGAILIGAQIAMRVHSNLMMMLMEKVNIPGEETPIASMTNNTFTYNSMYSAGELEDYTSEYRNNIEEQRIAKQHTLNKLLADGGEIDPNHLRHHVVIVVSDGLQNGMSLDVAADYLKPYKMKKLIIVTPIASVEAVDRMHLIADEIYCLSVIENMMDINHYYEENTIPDQKSVLKITHNIALNWQT